jgi:hypothetical protein
VFRIPTRAMLVSALVTVTGLTLLLADSGPNHQKRNLHFGVSGGNVNNHSKAFCCSGTLGSLVRDQSNTQFILSNNHVLADVDQASPGEDISQPGLIDNSCQPATTVANYSDAVPLGTANVDAALAQLIPNQMDGTGYIEDIGVPNSTAAAASVNAGVAKSGRTTGLTCGTVTSVNTTVKVQYQKGCNQGKKFTLTYTNQVVIGSGFSAGGDSGSLIVTQNNASPTALLYAGSSSTTIGNPIQEVTAAFANRGAQLSFVGANRSTAVSCPAPGGGGGGQGHGPHAGQIAQAAAVKERHVARLMADPAIMAVGIGADQDNLDLAVITIFVHEGMSHAPLPEMLDGVPTRIFRTDLIRAYGWNESETPVGQSCSVERKTR